MEEKTVNMPRSRKSDHGEAGLQTGTRGRPRSEKAHASILRATAQLLETTRLARITIEQIAENAGVSKATIYRWWPHKVAVVIDAVLEMSGPLEPAGAHKSNEAALCARLRQLLGLLRGKTGTVIADIVSHGRDHPESLRLFLDRFLEPRRLLARTLVEKGKKSGEFTTKADTELIIDLLYGPIYYRLLVGHQPLTPELADEIFALAQLGIRG